jgi:hypothetical protein
MSSTIQATIRFLFPGLLVYGLCWLVCWVTGWCYLPEPKNLEEAGKGLIGIVGALAYYLSGLRDFSNWPFFDRVTGNITALLAKPFEATIPTARTLPWAKVSIVFYHFVDTDPSLKVQSDRLRFNGMLWSSAADLRAMAIIGLGLFALIAFVPVGFPAAQFDEARLLPAFAGLAAVALLSIPISIRLTKRQTELGTAQCAAIVAKHKPDLEEKLRNAVRP